MSEYAEGIEYVQNTITKVLENPQIDIMPASMALRVLQATLKMHLEDLTD